MRRLDPYRLRAAAVLLVGFACGILLAAAVGGRSKPPPVRTSTVTVPPTTPAASATSFLSPDASSAFAMVAQAQAPLSVVIALAPASPGNAPAFFGNDRDSPAFTTITVPVLVALLSRPGNRGLSSAEQQDAAAAIQSGDNAAAMRLITELVNATGGPAAALASVTRVLRRSGDRATSIPAIGDPGIALLQKTRWSARASAQFLSTLAQCALLPPDATDTILKLMNGSNPSEREGLGSVGFAPPVYLVNGSGDDGGASVVRQLGLVDPGGAAVAVSIVSSGSGSSNGFDTGQGAIGGLSTWAKTELQPVAATPAACSPG